MSLFLAALMCVTTLAGFGTTAYAAEETDEVYLVSFPVTGMTTTAASGGHGSHEFMNGWATDTSAIPLFMLWVRITAISVTALNPASSENG